MRPDARTAIEIADMDDADGGCAFRQPRQVVTGGGLCRGQYFVPHVRVRGDLFVDRPFDSGQLFGRQVAGKAEIAFRFLLFDMGLKGPAAPERPGDRPVDQVLGRVHRLEIVFSVRSLFDLIHRYFKTDFTNLSSM